MMKKIILFFFYVVLQVANEQFYTIKCLVFHTNNLHQ